MKKALFFAAAVLVAPAVACDSNDDAETEYEAQVEESEVLLEDALTTVDEGGSEESVIVDAVFELGVDTGFYLIEVIEGDDLIVFEVAGRTGERHEVDRRRAQADRAELARRHRAWRRRLAGLVREIRVEHRARAVRARLAGDDAEVEVIDDRGRRHNIRRRLANAEEDDRGRG